MEINFKSFRSASENVDSLADIRKQNGERVLDLHIGFFDDCIRGIGQTDIVLLGAGSGVGKTEAAAHIAYSNAAAGKKILFLALEAENLEIEQRQMYKIFARRYFADKQKQTGVNINYTDFQFNRLDHVYDKYKKDCVAEMKKVKNLYTRYTTSEYTLDQLVIDVENASDMDAIMLDHLHIMSLGGEAENKAFKSALIKIRSIVLEKRIPMIILSQLRKDSGQNQNSSVMPDISDFHGSSDIFKIATKGIMFASGVGVVDASHDRATRRPTLVKVVKNRTDGSTKIYTGATVFDVSTNSYDEDYVVGNLKWVKDEETKMKVEKFIPTPEGDLPFWAKKDKRKW